MASRSRVSEPLVSLIIILAASVVSAPLVGAGQLQFETLSVKRAERCSLQNSADPGMIALRGDPLRVVFMEAFSVSADQIVGPSWLDGDCFEIIAKLPPGASKAQVPEMLRALLVERFKLTFHKEMRTRPGFALLVGDKGLKLKESDPNSRSAEFPAGQVTFGAASSAARIKGSMTMASLARLLSNRLKTPVEDLTGLNEKYDVDLRWVPDQDFEKGAVFGPERAATGSPDAPTVDLFTSVRNSLGLKLEDRKQQVEFVVIDHIERIPVEN